MYYFRYEMKLQLIPYIEEDIRNFLQHFQSTLHKQKDRQKYYHMLEQKISAIDKFYDRNYHDFRAHLIMRSKKLLVKFSQEYLSKYRNSIAQNTHKLQSHKNINYKLQSNSPKGLISKETSRNKLERSVQHLKKEKEFKKPQKFIFEPQKQITNLAYNSKSKVNHIKTQPFQLKKNFLNNQRSTQKITPKIQINKMKPIKIQAPKSKINKIQTNSTIKKEQKSKNITKPQPKMSKDQYIKYLITKTI